MIVLKTVLIILPNRRFQKGVNIERILIGLKKLQIKVLFQYIRGGIQPGKK